MDTAHLAALVAGALAVLGVCGIIMPVLPGSIAVGCGLLVWAVWGSSAWGWLAFAVGLALVGVGATSSAVLTKRSLDRRQIPKWPLFVALACGVIGTFLLPAVGLFVGFVVGLLVSEWIRVGNLRGAVSTSLVAVKAIGIGMVLELGCALLAATVLAVSIVTAFR